MMPVRNPRMRWKTWSWLPPIPVWVLVGVALAGILPARAQGQPGPEGTQIAQNLTLPEGGRPGQVQQTTAFAGAVQAELRVTVGVGLCLETAELTILRQGQVRLAQDLEVAYGDPSGLALCNLSDLRVLDLDGDGEAEVLLKNFSGGAHCCFASLIYGYDAEAQTYRAVTQAWGNGDFELRDLDLATDGGSENPVPEWLSRDDRFAYRFASYAASRYPLQIWRYQDRQLQDVTRAYPEQVYGDAYGLWREYGELRQRLPLPPADAPLSSDSPAQVYLSALRAVLAAYQANKYSLGQETDGWQRLEQLYPWRDRPTFIADLTDQLRDTGYITGSFTRQVRFFPGGSFDTLSGRLLPGDVHRYRLSARAGQQLQLSRQAGSAVEARLLGPTGQLLGQLGGDRPTLGRALPQGGSYSIEVTAPAETRYQLFVEIP